MVAGCSCVLAAFLSRLFLGLGHPCHPRQGKEKAGMSPLPPSCFPSFPVLWHTGWPACRLLLAISSTCALLSTGYMLQDLELLGKGSWAISASGSNLVLSPCIYVNIFGLGSYCCRHFVSLFRRKRLNLDNSPLPSVFVHNWILLVQCKL